MKKMLKLGVTLSLLTFTAGLFGHQDCCLEIQETRNESCCVYLAPLPYCFSVEGRAVYLQPSGSNLHYVAEAVPLPLPSPHWKIDDINPDYHFGFEVGLNTTFRERSSKLMLNWTHLYSNDSGSKSVSSSDMLGPFFEIGPDALPYIRAKGHSKFYYDAVNFDYGLCVNFGDDVHTVFYGGVGGAYIKQTLTATYSNSQGTVSRTIKTPSSFLGAGPQLGLDFTYDVCGGFSLTGGGSATLLVGTLKNHTTYDSLSPFLPELDISPPNHQSTKVRQRNGLVPAFEGKLGIAYALTLCGCIIDLEIGYEAKIYLNAIQSVDMGSEVVTPPVAPDAIGVFARTFQRNKSDFSLAGPYINVNAKF